MAIMNFKNEIIIEMKGKTFNGEILDYVECMKIFKT